MAVNSNDLTTIRQYLLGQLAEEEQQILEQRLLTEDDLFQELEIVEDELVDDFVAKELSANEQAQFERHFCSTPERQQDVKFAAGLGRYISGSRYISGKTVVEKESDISPAPLYSQEHVRTTWTSPTQLFRIAAIFATLVIVAGVFWSFRDKRQLPQSYATFTLTISNNNRADSGTATEVKLPLSADAVRLYLKLPEPVDRSARYRVELLKDTGEITNIDKVALLDNSAVVEFPAAKLAPSQYALKVYVVKSDGAEQRINGSYFLSVK
ncbi:MAG TPA: hypothetical protein VGO68_00905 [Pyrinomonadaceae bacterium]|jgi:hypothetical protein|nr:hypothetical protein [Pyrinomonadaceae bacterium]